VKEAQGQRPSEVDLHRLPLSQSLTKPLKFQWGAY